MAKHTARPTITTRLRELVAELRGREAQAAAWAATNTTPEAL